MEAGERETREVIVVEKKFEKLKVTRVVEVPHPVPQFEFDAERWGNGFPPALLCPACGSSYIHLDGPPRKGPPNSEVDLRMDFWCEGCSDLSALEVQTHKGQVWFTMLVKDRVGVPEPTRAPVSHDRKMEVS